MTWRGRPDRIFPLADLSELPTFDGPLIRAAGPMLTGRDGYPTRASWAPAGTGREVDGREDAAAIVGQLAAAGATAIKVSLNAEAGPTPSDGELAAICEAAHDAGLPVTVHAQGEGQVERALGAGVDELAHTPWTHRLSEDVIAMLAARMRIVSTLDILSFGRDTPAIRTALDNLRRFHDAGGTVIYGTDLGNGAIPAGHRRARAAAAARGGPVERGRAGRDDPGAARDRRAGRPDRAARGSRARTCARSTTCGSWSAPAGSSAADVTPCDRRRAPNRSSNTTGQPVAYSARASSASGPSSSHLRCTSVTVVPPSVASNVTSTSVYGRSSSFGFQSSTRRRPGSHAVTTPQSPSEPSDRIS